MMAAVLFNMASWGICKPMSTFQSFALDGLSFNFMAGYTTMLTMFSLIVVTIKRHYMRVLREDFWDDFFGDTYQTFQANLVKDNSRVYWH